MRFDLHVHSEYSSDGCLSIEEIVRLAREKGLDGVAICDHDRVLPDPPVFDGFLLIPGTEVSTERGHLLGLFVTKPVASRSLPDAIAEIRAQGGLAVMAHPFEHSADEHRLDDVCDLLDGIEVWNARADRKNHRANAMARTLAERTGRRPFAGSDAHVAQEIGAGVTELPGEYRSLEALREALVSQTAVCGGTESPARYTAKSQYIRRRKTGAGPGSWIKWGLFAVRCTLQDLLRKDR